MNVIGNNIKTINANLTVEMVDEILYFHNKGNIFLDEKFKSHVMPHTLSLEQLHLLERSDFEIVPFHDADIDCQLIQELHIKRYRSAQTFKQCEIPFVDIINLLANAFAVGKEKSRPYPSGGALYPIEVICAIFSEKILNAPVSGFYHYRPHQQVLQLIKPVDSQVMRTVLFAMELKGVNSPNFAILYTATVGKMLVKYRYRGYRYALMETGAMFQQADLVAQALGMSNKLYSGFNDHELMKFIGLDRMNFIPFVIQSFGVYA